MEFCHPRTMTHESLLLWPPGHCLPLVLGQSLSPSFDITGSVSILVTSSLSCFICESYNSQVYLYKNNFRKIFQPHSSFQNKRYIP